MGVFKISINLEQWCPTSWLNSCLSSSPNPVASLQDIQKLQCWQPSPRSTMSSMFLYHPGRNKRNQSPSILSADATSLSPIYQLHPPIRPLHRATRSFSCGHAFHARHLSITMSPRHPSAYTTLIDLTATPWRSSLPPFAVTLSHGVPLAYLAPNTA